MSLKGIISALPVIALVLLVTFGPVTRTSYSSSSLAPTSMMHIGETEGVPTVLGPASSNIYRDAANLATLQETIETSTDRGFSTSSLKSLEGVQWDVTADSWIDAWSRPEMSRPIVTNRRNFAETHHITQAAQIVYTQAEDPPLVIDVATDKASYHTDETISVVANITHQNGTVMTPPGWANVSITVWDISAYYWTVLPRGSMTYDSGTGLWDYNYTVRVTDPSAQFPFHWNITVEAYDGVLDAGVGHTTVNTLVYVGPGVSRAMHDSTFPEFGSIVVDGGVLSISNATIPMVPAWDMACNLTVRNNGTMMMEETAIGSLSGYYYIFWILDDSEAHLNHAEVYDVPPMMMGPPGLMAAFYASVFITNSSYIESTVGAMFSGSVSMEDSEAAEGAILMENSEGSFHNVTMPQLMLQSHCEASVQDSDVPGDAIFVALFSQIDIVNSYIDVVAIIGNSTATILNSTVDEQVAVVYSSSITADNLTIGDDMSSSVRLDVSGHSECNINDFQMMGNTVSIAMSYMSKAAFKSVNWTATHIDLRAEDNVQLAISDACVDATTAMDSTISLTVVGKAAFELLNAHLQATSWTQIYISNRVTANLDNVDIYVSQPATAMARLQFNVYDGSNVTLSNCNFNATGPSNWNTQVGLRFEYGVQASAVNVTVHSAYNFYSSIRYDTRVTMWNSTFSGLGDWCYFRVDDSSITMQTGLVTGGLYLTDGARLEMHNTTIDDYLELEGSCEATIQNCSIGFGPNINGYVNIYEGSVMTMTNVSINLSGSDFRVDTSCDMTLENVDVVSPFGYNFVMYGASTANIINSNINLNTTQFGEFYVDGGAVTIEGSILDAFSFRMSNAVYSFVADTELYSPVSIDGGCVVTMDGCLLNSTLASQLSETTLTNCVVNDDATTAMGGSLTLDTTTIAGTLYIGVAGTITVTDSTVTVEAMGGWPEDVFQSVSWLNAYDSAITLNGTTNALWIYNLHNHYNTSIIYTPGTVNILRQRWCLGVHVTDDYGEPIPSALVEIRNSTMDLVHTSHTDANGLVRIYPGNGVYNVTTYANGKMDTDIVTIDDMCAEASLQLDITDPMISNVAQDPITPNYKQSVTVTAEISDPTGITSVTLKYDDGGGWTDATMSLVSGNQYSGTIPAQAYGTHVQYYIVAVDNSDNTATSEENSYTTIDNLMPEASDFATDPASPMYYQDVTVTVILTDPNGVVEAWLIFSVDDTEFRSQLTSVGANRYSAVIPKHPFDVEVTYRVWAKDGLDNAGTTTPLAYTVGDDVDPTGEIVSPSTDSLHSGTIEITVTGQDTNFDRMELYVDDDLKDTWTTSGLQGYTLDTTTYADGSHMVRLLIYDQAGNSVETTITVTLDNTRPTVSITSPEQDAELLGIVNIDFDVSDTHLNKIYLQIDEALLEITDSSTFDWDTTEVADGSHTLTVMVTDKAGNQEEAQVTVKTTNVAKTVGENMIISFAAGSAVFFAIGAAASYLFTRRKKPTPAPAEISKPTKAPERVKDREHTEPQRPQKTPDKKSKRKPRRKSKSRRKP